MASATVGLAFSGGGIRSAAFCSGVLRRLLQKNVKIDYLSCVSGGGFTGSAYMDWKYRYGKQDDTKWHQEFFNHMRERAGFICNFQKPCQAVVEFLAIFGVILFVCVVVPILVWMSVTYPLAFIIDFLFGKILRGGPPCFDVVKDNPNVTRQECEMKRRTSEVIYPRYALFLVPILLSFLCFVLKGFIPKAKYVFKYFSIFFIAFSALTFLPWFISDFLRFVPTWMKFAVLIPFFLLWISFPLIRSFGTVMTGIYFCSFVIYWRVYHDSVFGFEYDNRKFNLLLGIATLLHWIAPLMVTIQQRLGHVYAR